MTTTDDTPMWRVRTARLLDLVADGLRAAADRTDDLANRIDPVDEDWWDRTRAVLADVAPVDGIATPAVDHGVMAWAWMGAGAAAIAHAMEAEQATADRCPQCMGTGNDPYGSGTAPHGHLFPTCTKCDGTGWWTPPATLGGTPATAEECQPGTSVLIPETGEEGTIGERRPYGCCDEFLVEFTRDDDPATRGIGRLCRVEVLAPPPESAGP